MRFVDAVGALLSKLSPQYSASLRRVLLIVRLRSQDLYYLEHLPCFQN